jgi:outer membrane protein TolC
MYLKSFIVLLGLLLFPLSIVAADSTLSEMSEGNTPLTLHQVVRLTLERNLNLRAEQFDTRASQAAVGREFGLYDPLLLVGFSTGESQQQINQQNFEAENHSQFDRLVLSLEQSLPTGGELLLGFDNQRNEEKEDPLPGINPAYESELALQLTQPLLKGFGRSVAEQDILFAVNDRQVAVQDLREVAFALLAEVRNAYYEVLRLRDNLRFRETSVSLAQKILNEASARVRAGILPPVDILEAEFGLKERERLQLDADREYRDSLDRLALLMSSRQPLIIAEEALGRPVLAVDEELGLQQALGKRPDLQRRIRQLERLDLEQRLARNDLLPGLDLTASYSHKGLGSDYSDNLNDVGGGDYPNWLIGLNLSYPLGNRTARYEHRRTLLRIKGRQAELAQLQEEIRTQIRAAIRSKSMTKRSKWQLAARPLPKKNCVFCLNARKLAWLPFARCLKARRIWLRPAPIRLLLWPTTTKP